MEKDRTELILKSRFRREFFRVSLRAYEIPSSSSDQGSEEEVLISGFY